MESPPPLDAAESGRKPREWEAKGTVFGLVLDIGGSFAKHVVVSLSLLEAVHFYERDLCKTVDYGHFMPNGAEEVCEYVSSYMQSFAALTVASVILMAARDLLQKRFYYRVLEKNCSVEFRQGGFLRDPVMLLLIWGFLHLCAVAAFVFYWYWKYLEFKTRAQPIQATEKTMRFIQSRTLAFSLAPETLGIPEKGIPPGADPAMVIWYVKRLEEVCGWILMAAASLFFLFSDYDIAKRLVTLNEFVDCRGTEEDPERPLSTLQVLPELDARAIVDQHFGQHSELTSQQRALTRIIEIHRDEKRSVVRDVSTPVHLLDSLWPGRILLEKDEDKEARSFVNCWRTFLVLATLTLALVIVQLSAGVYRTGSRCMNGTTAAAIPTLIKSVHLAVVCVVAWRIWTCSTPRAAKF